MRPLLLCAASRGGRLLAHDQAGPGAGLPDGLWHPVSGLDHVLAMIAVGLWGAQLGPPAVWLLPVTFPMVMAFGGFLGLVGVPLPGVEIGIALSAVLLGLMVAREAKPPLAVAACWSGSSPSFTATPTAPNCRPGRAGLTYSIGFVVATGVLHGVGIAIGVVHRWQAGRIALRVAGAAVAVAGIAFLWRAVA